MGNKKIINGCFVFLIFFAFTFSSIQISYSMDTLEPGQSITDFQTITSSAGFYHLQFFSPDTSSRNRYVGIRYNDVDTDFIVWVANRENPISDSSGTFDFTREGHLVISQGGQAMLMLYSGNATSNSNLKLLDSGNLVLREGISGSQGQILWQSFDHPTDTLLPGMILGINFKTGTNSSLTSSISNQVLAPGAFSLGVDPNGTKQFVVWERAEIYLTSGVWEGMNFNLVPVFRGNKGVDFSFFSTEEGHFFTFTVDNGSSGFLRLVMYPSGAIGYTDTRNGWGEVQISCLGGLWIDGCAAQGLSPNCSNGDQFSFKAFTAQLDSADQIDDQSVGLADCEISCRRNCSCTAYSSAYTNGTGCMFWHGEVVYDDQVITDPHYVYSRVPYKEVGGHKRSKKVKLIVILTISLMAFALISIVCLVWSRKLNQRGENEMSEERILYELNTDRTIDDELNFINNLGEGTKKGPDLPLVSFAFISTATDNFSDANKLGEGGFGPVYKGKLANEKEIAVKRLSRKSGQGLQEFKNEIILIAKLQHMNLVRLIGCCFQGQEKILIYEYMPNKSLDFYLFDSTRGGLLDWGKRVKIIEGIAQGLLYLHKYSRLRIIHRDLKASNILLDCEMNPKISDFGMARIFCRNETQANTERIVGTYCYMSPEYAMEGLFSEKSDVFSFGVLLLEIVSGKRSTSLNHSEHSLNLIGYAWELWKDGRGLALVDPILGDTFHSFGVLKYIHVALLCVQERATDRPAMSDVVSMLSNESVALPNPKQPAFLIARSLIERDSQKNKAIVVSINEVTTSEIKGR